MRRSSKPRTDSRSTNSPARLGRRTFLAAAAMAPAAAWAQRYEPGALPLRYPDADIVSLDPRFKKYAIGNTPIQRLYTGLLWAEGPAWNGGGRFLVWSDIPNDRQL